MVDRQTLLQMGFCGWVEEFANVFDCDGVGTENCLNYDFCDWDYFCDLIGLCGFMARCHEITVTSKMLAPPDLWHEAKK